MSKITVKAKSDRGFRRAGIQFTRDGVEIDTSKLKKGELEAIESDTNLIVTRNKEEGGNKSEILLGSNIQPATFKFGDHDAQLGDIVSFAFNVSKKTIAEWNDSAFDDEREQLLQQCVDGFTADPSLFAKFVEERAKAIAEKSRGKNKAAK